MSTTTCAICDLGHELALYHLENADSHVQRRILAVEKANNCTQYIFKDPFKLNLAPTGIFANVEGKCYRIATESKLDSLNNNTVNEIAKEIIVWVRDATQPCGCTPPQIQANISVLERAYCEKFLDVW